MHQKKWIAFPHDPAGFQFKGKALSKHWDRLHLGDCEPFPDEDALADRIRHGGIDTAPADVAAAVQDAWRAYHSGDFRRAFDLGTELGLPGFAVAVKALGVYGSYLEPNSGHAQSLLLDGSKRAEAAISQVPKDANAHYLYAFTLGRYSQRISVIEALARGFAPKIEHSLQQALKLRPKHADAHIALGLYHAEIIGKLGSLAGGLSYGVSSGKAIEHFRKALKLTPDAPVAKLEYARGLQLIDRDEHAAEIDRLLHEAAKCRPVDAMEQLDCDRAKQLLK